MLTDEDRKYIIHEFLNYISGISDKNYQRRIWIRGEGPECDDFDETTNYFLPIGEEIINEYKHFWITDKQYVLLKKLWKKFDEFCDSDISLELPQDFIDTPEWTRITIMAKEVLIAFGWHNE